MIRQRVYCFYSVPLRRDFIARVLQNQSETKSPYGAIKCPIELKQGQKKKKTQKKQPTMHQNNTVFLNLCYTLKYYYYSMLEFYHFIIETDLQWFPKVWGGAPRGTRPSLTEAKTFQFSILLDLPVKFPLFVHLFPFYFQMYRLIVRKVDF